MARRYTALTFGEHVKAVQEQYGSRQAGEMMENFDLDDFHLTPREAEFIEERDSFYMATVGDEGWPYVQFRGGPKGFLKALDATTLGYVDYGGNRQYISTGNLMHDDRVALILMDYAGRRRLKVMARTTILDAESHPDLVQALHDPAYRAKVERVVLFRVEAFDWNCPQHITPRFTEDVIAAEVEAREAVLLARIDALEADLAKYEEASGSAASVNA